MKTRLKMMLCGLVGFASIGAAPVSAAPLSPPPLAAPVAAAQADQVVKVQYDGRRPWIRQHYRGQGNWGRQRDWRGGPRYSGIRNYDGPRRPQFGRPYYGRPHYRPYYGRPHYRPYYRHHRPYYGSGFQVIIGAPAYAPYYYAPRRVYRPVRAGGSHTRWCYARYKTYRAWDNAYVANRYGERRYCHSPYRR